MNFYFLLEELNDQNPLAVNDQHTMVVFAQGLQSLQIPFCGNRNFLPHYESSGCLIQQGPLLPTATLVTTAPHRFETELASCSNPLLLMNTRDEWNAHEFDKYSSRTTLYFRSSYHASTQQPNVKPFAFSLSNRILKATEDVDMSKWSEREPVLLEAHRVTNHTVRNYVKQYYLSGQCPVPVSFYNDKFSEPTDSEERFLWGQSGRRHSMAYYNKLKQVQMLDAHGGYMHPTKLVQVDSWKLWEGFAAGCLIVAPDFNYYGIKLPYELIGLKHYIPIRYDKIKESYQILARLTGEQKQRIATEGRAHVLKNYCPEGMASYVLRCLKG
jgi:hypothetical protein